jgi:40-residue YVTN family beta-propeller repeat
VKLHSRGKKESVPLLLYMPQKQSGFLCPPDRIRQTAKIRKKRQKSVKSAATKPKVMAAPQSRYKRQPLRKPRGREVAGWLDRLDEELVYEPAPAFEPKAKSERLSPAAPASMQAPAEVTALVPVPPPTSVPVPAPAPMRGNMIYIFMHDEDRILVMDGETEIIVDQLPLPAGSPDHDISIIRGWTNTRLFPDVPIGHEPGLAAIHPETNLIYVPNCKSNSVTVIDGGTNAVVATITEGIGDKPYAAGVDSFANLVYVSNSGSDSVSVIDAARRAVVETIPVGGCPKAIAVNTRTNRIYVAVMNGVAVIDGETYEVVNTIATAAAPSDQVLYE